MLWGLCAVAVLVVALSAFMEIQEKPSVSVVMPVYNTQKYLDQAISSVLKQTFKDFEFIIVDDASTDKSAKIIERYAKKDKRIRFFKMKKNSGAAAARNEGIKHIKGDYVLFVDSDDWLGKTALEKAYNHAVANDLDMVLFLAVVLDEQLQAFYSDKNIDFRYEWLEEMGLSVFSYKDFPDNFFSVSTKYPWNKLIKTSLIKERNLYFDNVPHHNDSFFITMAMVYAKRIGYIKDRLYFYRINRKGAISANGEDDVRSVWLTFKKIKEELIRSGLYPELKESFNFWLSGWVNVFVKMVVERNPDQQIYQEKMRELMD